MMLPGSAEKGRPRSETELSTGGSWISVSPLAGWFVGLTHVVLR